MKKLLLVFKKFEEKGSAISTGKKFSASIQIIAETEPYFQVKDKSYYMLRMVNCTTVIIIFDTIRP